MKRTQMSGAPLGDKLAGRSHDALEARAAPDPDDVVGRHTPRVEEILSAAHSSDRGHAFHAMVGAYST
jgi:hypothetical protein